MTMRAIWILLAACGSPRSHAASPGPLVCPDAPAPHVEPIDILGYPITRRPLTDAERVARRAELDAAHPGWHFSVDLYGAPETASDDPTPTPQLPFPHERFAALVATLQHEHLLPNGIHEVEGPGLVQYVDGAGIAQVSAAAFPASHHETFLNVGFPPPPFPVPAGAHVLTTDELFARWDPNRDHSAIVELLYAQMPCDRVVGEPPCSQPASPPPRCVPVRELDWAYVVISTGTDHQRLVYQSRTDGGGAITQMSMPRCIDAVTGGAVTEPCPG